MTKFRCALAALLATGLLAGCGQGDVSIGEAGSKAVIGGWTGYIENFKFASGSDALQITVDGASGDQLTGHAIFGAGPMLPPPTDPNVGYPASGPYAPTNYVGEPIFNRTPAEGFAFTLLEGTLSDSRFRFRLARGELFRSWCEMQTPVASGSPPKYGCLRMDTGTGGNGAGACFLIPDGEPNIPVDCGKLELCSWELMCTCTEQACTLSGNNGNLTGDIAFDLNIEGDQATGSEIGVDSQHNVHLTRGQ